MPLGPLEILIIAVYVVLALGFFLLVAVLWRVFRYLGWLSKEHESRSRNWPPTDSP